MLALFFSWSPQMTKVLGQVNFTIIIMVHVIFKALFLGYQSDPLLQVFLHHLCLFRLNQALARFPSFVQFVCAGVNMVIILR